MGQVFDTKISEDGIKEMGFYEECFLSYLRAKYGLNKPFWASVDELKRDIGISQRTQFLCFKLFEEKGYIEILYKGVPPKRYITILK